MSECVLALTTLPANFDAVPLAQDLVGAGLAACVTIIPAVQSVYSWQGVPQADKEQQLIIKTTDDRTEALWDALRPRHPYDVPEFLVIPVVEGNPDYLKWVVRSAGPKPES